MDQLKRLTVIIPTLNEALHIERSIGSVKDFANVVVVDSGSADGTQGLASACGATVREQVWLGHAGQKNWALDNLEIVTPWVMFLDADEIVPAQLAEEIQAKLDAPGDVVAWHIPRRNIFMGRSLDHVWWYPDYQTRLFKRGSARYEEREVHEHMVVTGRSDILKNPLVHESLKGVDEFLERHMRYARAEAVEIHASTRDGAWLGAGRAGRRRALKTRVWYRLRQRPLARFLWLYVVRRGYLDGAQGRIYAQLIGAYEAMIDAYILELTLKENR